MYKTINEAHGLAPADIKRVKDLIEKTKDKEIKRILKFLVKSNVEVDKTQDVTKMKKENKHPMKITRKILARIIKEEIDSVIAEGPMDTPAGMRLSAASQLKGEAEPKSAQLDKDTAWKAESLQAVISGQGGITFSDDEFRKYAEEAIRSKDPKKINAAYQVLIDALGEAGQRSINKRKAATKSVLGTGMYNPDNWSDEK